MKPATPPLPPPRLAIDYTHICTCSRTMSKSEAPVVVSAEPLKEVMAFMKEKVASSVSVDG